MSATDDARRIPSADAPAGRDALIEHLLMAGLDEYFAGRHERAIQVWSRVFFLDRTHPRARAYIDRARGALAEGQREAEARASAESPMERSGAELLARIDRPRADGRVDRTASPRVHGTLAARARDEQDEIVVAAATPAPPLPTRSRAQGALVVLAGVLLFVAGYTVAARDRLADWWTGRRPADNAGPSVTTPAMSAETALNVARQAIAAGRFDDARRALAHVAPDDPLRRQADALLAELQQALQSLPGAAATAPRGAAAEGGGLLR
ncbi:MAG TPA: hypothetical protein VIL35_05810 [Vicinamibacterales bacterium]